MAKREIMDLADPTFLIVIFEVLKKELIPVYSSAGLSGDKSAMEDEEAGKLKSQLFKEIELLAEKYCHQNSPDRQMTDKIKIVSPSGNIRWFCINISKVIIGEHEYLYAGGYDFSDQKLYINEMNWENEKNRILNNLTHDVTYDYDAQTDTIYYYVAPSDVADGDEKKIDKYMSNFIHSPASVVSRDSTEYFNAFALAEQGQTSGMVEYKADYYGSGYRHYRTEWFRITPENEKSYHIIGVSDNIENEIDLRHRASRDSLTNLLNRQTIEVRINDNLKSGYFTAGDICAVLDIDEFKKVNDTKGHLVGDAMLRELGNVLTDVCLIDDLAARTGGDEFLLFFHGKTVDQVSGIIQSIVAKCNDYYQQPIFLSIGAYVLDGSEKYYPDVMSKADTALYHAKRNGKNQIVFFDSPIDSETEDTNLLALEHTIVINKLNVSVSKHFLDDHYTLIYANDRYYSMFGYSKEEYEKNFHNHPDLFFKNDPETWNSLVSIVSGMIKQNEKSYSFFGRMKHKNGKFRMVQLYGNLTGEVIDGHPVSYSIMIDITDQIKTQQEKNLAYESSPGPVSKFILADQGFELLSANTKYHQIFSERTFYSFDDLNKEDGLNQIAENYHRIINGQYFDCTISPKVNNRKMYFRVCGKCIDWENGKPVYFLTYENITELIHSQKLLEKKTKQLERFAYVDSVTGGINSHRFYELTEDLLRNKSSDSYALCMLNVDKFKLINDLFGRDGGDKSLMFIHDKLKKKIGDDELISRIQADNFALLLHFSSKKEILERLRKMICYLNEFVKNTSDSYHFVYSVGIYAIPAGEEDVLQMIDKANLARSGKRVVNDFGNCRYYFYDDEIIERIKLENEIATKTNRAFAEEQFLVYYQPKIQLSTEEVAGAEALVRWQDPDRGLIPPDEFIPVFERSGDIVRLDLYVFTQVCKQIAHWIESGIKPVPISVNLSRVHFVITDFINKYVEICDKYNVPHNLIDIEVTETIALDDIDKFSSYIKSIHDAGFTCSMDDFGSGYSSLNLLKDIDIDTVKLDRAFFSSPEMEDEKEASIISTMVELINRLKMTSIAEGVETEKQKNFLKSINCNFIQGFVYSKPLSIEEFEKFVTKKNKVHAG